MICLTSCQKDFSVSENLLQNAAPDSNFLDKIYILQQVNGLLDTTGTIIFAYDNLKRNTSRKLAFNNSSEKEDYIYSYSGTDTLPFLIKYISDNFNEHDTVITYQFYNTAGKKIRDSSVEAHQNISLGIYDIGENRRTYTYTPSKIIKLTREINPGFPDDFSKDSAVLDLRGNIVFSQYTDISNGGSDRDYTYTYDNRPSPYKKLTAFYFNYNKIDEYYSGFFDPYYTYNNILTADENGDIYAYTYIYNTAGYPATVSFITNSAPSLTKLIYKYKTL